MFVDIATKEMLIPWVSGVAVFLISFSLGYCLYTSSPRALFWSFIAFLVGLFGGMYFSVSWGNDIAVFSRNKTFQYMASTDATDWSLDNEHAKIFKVDGKTFLTLDGRKYEVETTPTRDFFVRTMKGEMVYAVSNKGEVVEF